MRRYYSDGTIPTLDAALIEHMNADDLKKLAKHTNQKIPTRKADSTSAKSSMDRWGTKAVSIYSMSATSWRSCSNMRPLSG